MASDIYYQSRLNSWNSEYCGKGTVTFGGVQKLQTNKLFLMGRCIWKYTSDGADSIVYINQWKKVPPEIIIQSVLWHEFVHHWRAAEDGAGGHGKDFQARKWRKPLYAGIDTVLKLVGWIWW